MNNFFSIRNLSKSFKNFLIFLPIIFSNQNINSSDLVSLFFGFIIFFIITNIIYIINDYTDKENDKDNKLKLKNNIGYLISKQNFFFINFLLIIFLILLFKTNYFNKYIFLYISNFYLYNFLLKKIKLLDLISLNIFYLARLGYGAELVGVELSLMFVTFFSTLFFILSIFKRIIQINVNNLDYKNQIISYNHNDIYLLKILTFLLLALNILTIFFLFDPPDIFSSINTKFDYEIISLFPVIIFYSLNFLRLINFRFNNKIKVDIFQFVVQDKLILFSSLISIIIIFLN